MTDNYVLVSGGSGGLGGALCTKLASAGCRPVVGYASNAERARQISKQTGGVAMHLDLADADSLAESIARLRELAGGLVGVVLAGSPAPVLCRFGKIDAQDLQRQLEVNVTGAQALLAGLVAGCFRKNKRGVVVGVLSDAMGNPGDTMPGMGAYIIGKYGLAGVLSVLAADYPWLEVHTTRPSFIDTPMLDVFDERFIDPIRERGGVSDPGAAADEIMAPFLHLLGAPPRPPFQ